MIFVIGFVNGLSGIESRRKGANFNWSLMSNQIDIAVPCTSIDNSHGADGAIYGVSGGDV